MVGHARYFHGNRRYTLDMHLTPRGWLNVTASDYADTVHTPSRLKTKIEEFGDDPAHRPPFSVSLRNRGDASSSVAVARGKAPSTGPVYTVECK